MSYSFIYFDLDDTLLDHSYAEKQALVRVHEMFAELQSVTPEQLTQVYHKVNSGLWKRYGEGHITRHELHKHRFLDTFEALSLDAKRAEEVGRMYMQQYRTFWKWIEGAKQAFELISKAYSYGIITNGFAETQWEKLRKFGMDQTARSIVISEEFGKMKPHPDVFSYAEEKALTKGNKILYVGDSLHSDVSGALKAGWDVAWFNRHSAPSPAEKPTLEFANFKELTDFLN